MFNDISEIIFTKKDTFSKENLFHIKRNDKENILTFIDNRYISNNEIIETIDDNIVILFIDNLFRIIDSWDTNYIINNNIDNTQWKLSIKFDNGSFKEYTGYNDFPDNFEALEALKYNIIESLGVL